MYVLRPGHKHIMLDNFHSSTVHLDIIKVFAPTDGHKFFKRSIKIYIKTAPTCFGVITIIRELAKVTFVKTFN
jgi:hypothetical protein